MMTKTVLITGASSGFGKDAARLFQKNGWNVIASMRSPEKETELGGLDNVLLVRLDVTDSASIASAVEQGIARFGGIDVLVNNAGFGSLGVLEAAPAEVVRQQFDVNVFGVIETIRAVLPQMRSRKSGVIINVASMGGRVAFPFSTLYHATKYAVEGLSESLQFELGPLGIQVKVVEPGGYKTDFAGRSLATYGAGDLLDYHPAYDAFAGKVDDWPMSENVWEVAEAIFEAATDGSEQLRYPVGADAIQLLEATKQMDDLAIRNMIAGFL
ncbi:short-chain dehydrogenase/reductase [Dyadobacter beijingensis]|uniref:Short-chain dehydrogenase/reductase n=1 Tax=Dyadobacter beijingensis TaxID=365489 RepID=A0ABQ2HNZ5_9BACT|nr:SDR family oxidoreductase [Dyadobacter beijingensis]GGM86538.1 short-chain dehydrogenase/reductase [Dyadobacter beijingensis]